MTGTGDGETALVVVVPEAEPLVGAHRARHDPSAAAGMPAHITVLYPFCDAAEVGADLLARLARLVEGHAAFPFTLVQVGVFPGTALYLAPEPADPFVAMTNGVAAHYPAYPPYRGIYDTIVPHLTVAQTTDAARLRRMAETFAAAAGAALPIAATARSVTLFEKHAGQWRARQAFPLGPN